MPPGPLIPRRSFATAHYVGQVVHLALAVVGRVRRNRIVAMHNQVAVEEGDFSIIALVTIIAAIAVIRDRVADTER